MGILIHMRMFIRSYCHPDRLRESAVILNLKEKRNGRAGVRNVGVRVQASLQVLQEPMFRTGKTVMWNVLV